MALPTNHLFVLFLLLLSGTSAAQSGSENMILLGQWNVDTLPRYSDVWGYARGGREYAIIGSREYVHVIDVTDPGNPTEIAALNSFDDSGSVWRDIKVFGDYAYCVTETQEGLQVIDLSNLPASAAVVHQDSTDFTSAHNIIIDSTSVPARLYVFGSRPGPQINGYLVYSLADPVLPELIATVDIDNTDDPSLGYIHDGYARNDTLYANHGGNGFYVYDVADPQNPVEIGSLTNYVEAGYNHSVWGTADGRHMVMCDETVNTGVKVISLDKSDPFFLDIQVESVFRSASLAPDTASLAHNPYVLGDSLVVLSYYGEGVQVWNIEDAAAPYRIGFYDTTPNQNTYGGGIWGAYPWLPSGNILASDINNGLFVVRVESLTVLPVVYAAWNVTDNGKDALLAWSTNTEDNNAGWQVEHAVAAGNFVAIGFVAAGFGDYQFTHADPGPGVHYYRLRQRDHDGRERLSEVRTVILDGAPEAGIALSPNPAPAAAPVSIVGAQTSDWELLSADGKLLRTGEGAIDTQALRPGVYLVRVGSAVTKLVID